MNQRVSPSFAATEVHVTSPEPEKEQDFKDKYDVPDVFEESPPQPAILQHSPEEEYLKRIIENPIEEAKCSVEFAQNLATPDPSNINFRLTLSQLNGPHNESAALHDKPVSPLVIADQSTIRQEATPPIYEGSALNFAMAAAEDPFDKDDDSDGDLIVLKRDSLAKVSQTKIQKFDAEEKPPSEAQMTKTVVLAL